MWNRFARKILVDRLKERQRKNAAFSLRAFALKTKMSAGSLSEFMAGKRRLSKESARKLMSHLDLTEAEREKFEHLLEGDNLREELKEETFAVVSHWAHFAVLSILEIDDPPTRIDEIAKRLGLPLEHVREVVSRLISLQLLEEADGKLELTGKHFVSTDEIPSGAVVRSHLEDFELAKKSLELTPVSERDFISLTFAGSSADLKKAKQEIRKFRDRLYTTMSSSRTDNVYKFSLQLYPLTDRGERS